ncbi:hypothetical protein [Aeromicrobium sp.]|uniref:hypothetical protein n=1 Tax=Aeromicrobium sp. TaxID=1871063 RepID=UPI002FCAD0FD
MSAPALSPVRAIVPAHLSVAQRVRLTACAMVVASLGLKAWVVLPAWFYSDDFRFIEEAHTQGLSVDFLFTPHDSQLMPLGRAISWVVAQANGYSWFAAASITLTLQLFAALTCLLMLRTLFGDRWGILVPLGLFLISPMGVEAGMWWSASLNALPMQIAFFLLVTCVVLWARERRPRWVLGAAGAITLAVLAGPRGLAMAVPVTLLIALFLTQGAWWRRPYDLVRQHLLLTVPPIAIGVGYLVVYARTTPAPVEASGDSPALELLRNLITGSWAPSLLGGPWRWDVFADPVALAAAPAGLEIAATIVVVGAAAWLVRRNPGPAGAAVAILVAQLTVTFVALVFGRGLQVGASAGLVSRYLADALPVTALAIGLATMPLLIDGAPAFRRQLPGPADLGRWPRRLLGTAAVVVVAGSLVSTARYAAPWHDDFVARAFVSNAVSTLRADPSPIADVEVPDLVQLSLHYPSNLPSHLLAPYGDLVQTTQAGNDLRILDESGRSRQAIVNGGAETRLDAIPGCGVRVGPTEAAITLDRDRMDTFPWTSINYVASGAGLVEVTADGREVADLEVAPGPHTYFFLTDGAYSTLTLRSKTPGTELCVDIVRAGPIRWIT